MARIQNHREMPFPSVTLSLTEKGVGQDRKRIYCGFLSESQQQHEAFVCRQNRADSVEKGPRGPLRAYRFSCSFNLPLRVDKPLADFPENATDNGDSSPRGSCPDQRLRLFPLFTLAFVLLFSSRVTTLLIAFALALSLSLSLALPGLLSLFLLLRTLTLISFVCHV